MRKSFDELWGRALFMFEIILSKLWNTQTLKKIPLQLLEITEGQSNRVYLKEIITMTKDIHPNSVQSGKPGQGKTILLYNVFFFFF